MLKHCAFNAITTRALRPELVAMSAGDVPITTSLPGSKDDGAQGLSHARPLIWNMLDAVNAQAKPEGSPNLSKD
jgi:hypothetical protein